jgi:hypothetical protein
MHYSANQAYSTTKLNLLLLIMNLSVNPQLLINYVHNCSKIVILVLLVNREIGEVEKIVCNKSSLLIADCCSKTSYC